jgi:xylulokinase
MLVCESGGASLEWYKKGFLPDIDFGKLNEEILKKELPNELIFLPYISGVNAPDYNKKASAVFYGIKSKHDKFDLAYAIMEGVSHLFTININSMKKIGVAPKMVISTGGGARSDLWSQLYADISKNTILIPENEEAGRLGVALMASVIDGVYPDLDQAIEDNVNIKKRFMPKSNPWLDNKHRLFNRVLNSMTPIFSEGAVETS